MGESIIYYQHSSLGSPVHYVLLQILNLRSYCLTLKTIPLFPWALLITAGMLLLTLPILSGACFSSLVQISIPSREVSILCSYLDITLFSYFRIPVPRCIPRRL